jgi:antitoxin component YwqK of YwqJK toxin-antitoxin module
MKKLLYLFICISLISCGEKEEKQKQEPTVEAEELVVIENGKYTEYYPGRKQVKFEGNQDDDKQRHGKWVFYGEDGTEISTAFYDHGIKHGHSVVRYPNGTIHYYGEYNYDEKIGVWKTYDDKGKLIEEKDFGPAK